MRSKHSCVLILTGLVLSASNVQANGEPIQNPVPRPIKSAEKEKPISASKDGNTTPNQKPSSQSPPMINVPNTQNDKQVKNEKAKQSDKPSTTDWMLVFTAVLAFAAIVQAGILIAQVIYNRALTLNQHVIERAYVKMSHCDPGLQFSEPPGICSVQIKVHNLGNTPARVTDVNVSHLILPKTSVLPAIPRYETRDELEESFLYKDDPFYFIRRFTLADSDREGMQNGTIKFYLYGYVDYIDQFGNRHRSGYGRQFDPHGRPDNLRFITQPNYNYDQLRESDLGRD